MDKSKDRTGLMAANCKHGVSIAACWMNEGEKHYYSHLLLMYIVTTFALRVRFFVYDIACMVKLGVLTLIRNQCEHIRNSLAAMDFVVPRWHAKGHIERCQYKHSLVFKDQGGMAYADISEHVFKILKTHTTSVMTHRNQSFALTMGLRRNDAAKIFSMGWLLRRQKCRALLTVLKYATEAEGAPATLPAASFMEKPDEAKVALYERTVYMMVYKRGNLSAQGKALRVAAFTDPTRDDTVTVPADLKERARARVQCDGDGAEVAEELNAFVYCSVFDLIERIESEVDFILTAEYNQNFNTDTTMTHSREQLRNKRKTLKRVHCHKETLANILDAADDMEIEGVIFTGDDVRDAQLTKGEYPWSLEHNRHPAVKKFVAAAKLKRAEEELAALQTERECFVERVHFHIQELTEYSPPQGVADFASGFRDDALYSMQQTLANFNKAMEGWDTLTTGSGKAYLERGSTYKLDGRGAQGKYAPLSITAVTCCRNAAVPVRIEPPRRTETLEDMEAWGGVGGGAA